MASTVMGRARSGARWASSILVINEVRVAIGYFWMRIVLLPFNVDIFSVAVTASRSSVFSSFFLLSVVITIAVPTTRGIVMAIARPMVVAFAMAVAFAIAVVFAIAVASRAIAGLMTSSTIAEEEDLLEDFQGWLLAFLCSLAFLAAHAAL